MKGLGRRTIREEIQKSGIKLAALRFQTRERYQKSPASIGGHTDMYRQTDKHRQTDRQTHTLVGCGGVGTIRVGVTEQVWILSRQQKPKPPKSNQISIDLGIHSYTHFIYLSEQAAGYGQTSNAFQIEHQNHSQQHTSWEAIQVINLSIDHPHQVVHSYLPSDTLNLTC